MTVGHNEAVGLFGPNGHGKTTLLKTVAGLIDPWEGNIVFAGERLNAEGKMRPRTSRHLNYDLFRKRRISAQNVVRHGLIYVMQGNLLFPEMTVEEVLDIAPRAAGDRDGVAAMKDLVDRLFPRIRERWRSKIRFLSGGERQMVSIAAGLLAMPRLLMLERTDTGAFRRNCASSCAKRLSKSAQGGVPLIVVDQNVEFLTSLVDRLYLFDHGAITREIEGKCHAVPRGSDDDDVRKDPLMPLETLAFILVSGLVLGGLYALMASGLAVVWTTLGVFNFAHGAMIALGAYIAWQVSQFAAGGAGFLLGAGMSVLIMFCFGFAMHYVLVKPFERHANLVLLAVITTLAAASIVENSILLAWGPRDKQIAPLVDGNVAFLGTAISSNDFVILGVALAALLVLAMFLRKSTTGRALRAVAQNREAAELMGFNVSRLFALTIGLSAATAALAGVFVGSLRFISPTVGTDPLMKSLIVVILGGVTRFTSPIYAAFIVGLAESFSAYFLGLYWAPAVLFAMMIIVLLIKPEGLFGRRTRTL